jgi:pyridoxal 5'-phosphate synthase pdxS subunit
LGQFHEAEFFHLGDGFGMTFSGFHAKAIVEATTHYADAEIVTKVSRGLGPAMKGETIEALDVKLAARGW